jgi:thiamine biosynthesis lipoprotein
VTHERVKSPHTPARRRPTLATTADIRFPALGTEVRIRVEGPAAPALARRARAEVERLHACLTRFDPASELSRLNADPRTVVPCSPSLRAAVRDALAVAEATVGAITPTLHDQLCAAGYDRTFEALATARPTRRPVRSPRPAAPAGLVTVDDDAGTIARPSGLRLDLGGTGKGHVADRVAALLAPAGTWVVDAGGDVRVGGAHAVRLDGTGLTVRVRDRAVATSSVARRAWASHDGRTAHHLLDARTGEPARTVAVQASALAPTVLEAETRAKLALLHGPAVLRRHGGVLLDDAGTVTQVGHLEVLA